MKEGLKFKIASILFRVVGYGAVALAVYFVIANTVFWVRSESAIGKVVAWEAMEGIVDRRHLRHNIDPAKATVVEFETSSGETIVFASKVGSGLDLYEKGEEVTVLYFEEDPQNAKLRGFFSLYMGPILLAVMGGVFAFFGVLLQFFYEPKPTNIRP